MTHSSRFVLLLGLCAAACSGVIDEDVAKPGAGAGGAGAVVGAGPSSAVGTGSTATVAATTGSAVGSTGTVSTGQGGTGPGSGGSSGQGGAQGIGGAADASGGRASFPDAADSAPRPDVGPGLPDAAVQDAAVGDGVGPIVPPDCAEDPSVGWTEYMDTFKIQRPYDLMVSDRYTFENGIHTFWVLPNDKAFEVGNDTAPRTEARYTNFTTGQKMWSGDILVDSPSNSVTIFQIHHTTTGAGPVYLQVNGGTLRELDGQLVLSNMLDKWFNLKVAFDSATASATMYINNCQKLVLRNSRPGDHVYYFKHGTYTCTSSVCRDHYKNIHVYQR